MKLLRTLAGIACLAAASAFGQASKADVQSMKMWPPVPVRWLGHTDFTTTNYGYYQDTNPMFSFTDGNFIDWNKWRFAIYTGLTGKRVMAWGDWGYPTPPPPPHDGTGSSYCEHTHVTWAIWIHYSYYIAGNTFSGWTIAQGGGKSGIQVNDYTCPHSVKNKLSPAGDNPFGWGLESWTATFPKTGNPYDVMILGASALSHSGLGCNTHGCINQPWIGAYTY